MQCMDEEVEESMSGDEDSSIHSQWAGQSCQQLNLFVHTFMIANRNDVLKKNFLPPLLMGNVWRWSNVKNSLLQQELVAN